jgi:(p)ppGpp synthase/HD superfamily hydrolase
MRDILLISRACNFAAQRHTSQKRKGKAQEPYVNHLAEVADLVATATDGQDANLVAAAVLHDTVEDTATPSNGRTSASRFNSRPDSSASKNGWTSSSANRMSTVKVR